MVSARRCMCGWGWQSVPFSGAMVDTQVHNLLVQVSPTSVASNASPPWTESSCHTITYINLCYTLSAIYSIHQHQPLPSTQQFSLSPLPNQDPCMLLWLSRLSKIRQKLFLCQTILKCTWFFIETKWAVVWKLIRICCQVNGNQHLNESHLRVCQPQIRSCQLFNQTRSIQNMLPAELLIHWGKMGAKLMNCT